MNTRVHAVRVAFLRTPARSLTLLLTHPHCPCSCVGTALEESKSTGTRCLQVYPRTRVILRWPLPASLTCGRVAPVLHAARSARTHTAGCSTRGICGAQRTSWLEHRTRPALSTALAYTTTNTSSDTWPRLLAAVAKMTTMAVCALPCVPAFLPLPYVAWCDRSVHRLVSLAMHSWRVYLAFSARPCGRAVACIAC